MEAFRFLGGTEVQYDMLDTVASLIADRVGVEFSTALGNIVGSLIKELTHEQKDLESVRAMKSEEREKFYLRVFCYALIDMGAPVELDRAMTEWFIQIIRLVEEKDEQARIIK